VLTQIDTWPIERIRSLTNTEVHNLRSNALARGNHAVAERCDQVLSIGAVKRSGRARSENRAEMNIPETPQQKLPNSL